MAKKREARGVTKLPVKKEKEAPGVKTLPIKKLKSKPESTGKKFKEVLKTKEAVSDAAHKQNKVKRDGESKQDRYGNAKIAEVARLKKMLSQAGKDGAKKKKIREQIDKLKNKPKTVDPKKFT
jgi:hypothetical protein